MFTTRTLNGCEQNIRELNLTRREHFEIKSKVESKVESKAEAKAERSDVRAAVQEKKNAPPKNLRGEAPQMFLVIMAGVWGRSPPVKFCTGAPSFHILIDDNK